MKFSLKFLALSIMVILAAGSCKNEKEPGTFDKVMAKSPSLRLITPQNKTHYHYGDTLSIQVDAAEEGDSVRTLKIYSDDNLLASADEPPFQFHFPTSQTGGGNIRLRFEATINRDRQARRIKSYKITSAQKPGKYGFKVVKRYPHDDESFTQGLLMHKGYLYESTGNYGESHIRKLNLATGEILKKVNLSNDYFGEGIAIFDNTIYQITYKSSLGFTYQAHDLKKTGKFTYNTSTSEGWGMTNNDTSIIMSDGSAFIHFCNPENMKVEKKLRVFDDEGDVINLNELELVGDTLLANIYTEPTIAKININTGRVMGYIDLRGVVKRDEVTTQIDVLNGIAVDPATGNLLVTGKYWPYIYEIQQFRKK